MKARAWPQTDLKDGTGELWAAQDSDKAMVTGLTKLNDRVSWENLGAELPMGSGIKALIGWEGSAISRNTWMLEPGIPVRGNPGRWLRPVWQKRHWPCLWRKTLEQRLLSALKRDVVTETSGYNLHFIQTAEWWDECRAKKAPEAPFIKDRLS